MPAKDVSFTFDTRDFENGINTIDKGMKGLKVGAGKMASAVATGMVVASAAIGIFKMALKGVRKVLTEMIRGMPEIGQAFKIAKDIMLRNFLYPIRKAIMPLLQKMLDWVRDHRAMFVKWGHVVVGIFKTILQIGRKVVIMIRRIWESAARILSNVFGTEIKRIGDLMNIMAFKISAIIQFLSALLRPLFETIGEIAEKIAEFGIKAVKDFFEGFIEGAPGAREAVGKVLESFKGLLQAMIDINTETGLFTKLFKTFGAIVGFLFVGTMQNIEFVIKSATFALRGFVKGLELLNEQRKIGAKRDPAAIAQIKEEREALRKEEREFYGRWGYEKVGGYRKLGETIGGILGGGAEPMVQENISNAKTTQTTIEVGGVVVNVPAGTTEVQLAAITAGLQDAVVEAYGEDFMSTGK